MYEHDNESNMRDKKYEGMSRLSQKDAAQKKHAQRAEGRAEIKDVRNKYIDNLQRQVTTMETEIKFLKEKEVEQKNRASGYETLLRDKIPLNEHFLALKNKYNNETGALNKKYESEVKRHEDHKRMNKNLKENIQSSQLECNKFSQRIQDAKDAGAKEIKDLETRLWTETHTKQ
jgi:chromosome segregation ATPase